MTTQNIDLSALRIARDNEGKGSPRSLRKRMVIFLAAAALLLILVLVARSSWRTIEIETTQVLRVQPSQASTVLTAAGYIVARSKAEISPKAVGRISWLNLEEGQAVRKGELVARLESQEWLAQKRQINASLAQARRDRDRYKKALEENAVAQQTYENAATQVTSLEAQLSYFEEQIKNAEIYSPIEGTVTVKKAYLGETVAPQGYGGAGSAGATFAVIVDMNSLEMEADISEQNLARLAEGQAAEIALDAYPQRAYRARLRQIVPTADRQKGSVKVKVELLERDAKILPEMSARVSFLDREPGADRKESPRVMAPLSSLVEQQGRVGLLMVRRNRAIFTPVELGERTETLAEIRKGAAGGETIVADAVTSGVTWRAEQTVRVKKE